MRGPRAALAAFTIKELDSRLRGNERNSDQRSPKTKKAGVAAGLFTNVVS